VQLPLTKLWQEKPQHSLDAVAYFLNKDMVYKEGVEGICNSISGILARYDNMTVIKNGAVI